MSRLLDIVSNNALISTILGAAIVGGIGWSLKAYKDHREKTRIYNFLAASKSATGYDFRSTVAIASNTNLSEDRVANLCASHPNIRRNEKQWQSWALVK